MINIELFVSTFFLIFVAELPDKTAFATVMLAARSRGAPVFFGVALAFVIQTLVAVAFGRALGRLPPHVVHIGAGLLFFAFAWQAWRRSRQTPHEIEAEATPAQRGFWKIAWSSFLVIFVAEWGDITQLATAALVAKSADEVTIFLAAVSALWSVTLLAVLVGRLLREVLSPVWLQRIAAVAFFTVGVYMISTSTAMAEPAPAIADVWVPEISVVTSAPARDLTPIKGQRLERLKSTTLGETLAHEAGVTASGFGPNASRPVLRGMEGDRVRIVENGTGVLDASAASQDHAVALDPLALESVEIVRGPRALMYGSQALGGVVNLTTDKIPSAVPPGLRARVDSKVATNDQGRSLGAGVTGGLSSSWAFHADGVRRAADDYHAPTPGRVLNSYNRTGNISAGTSYVMKKGYVGTAVSQYDSTYGTIVERLTHINMRRQSWDLSGEYRPGVGLDSIKIKNVYSHYRHDEIEAGALGTSFKNEGDATRIDFKPFETYGVTGDFGVESNACRFSARGAESFIPPTRNRSYSAFAFGERSRGMVRPGLGLRYDMADVQSLSAPDFGDGQRRDFKALSLSAALKFLVSAGDELGLNLAYGERAPNYEELFARGVHAATGLFEIGDPELPKERSRSAEVYGQRQGAYGRRRLGLYVQDYGRFIALAPAGGIQDDLPVYNYRGVSARFYGGEAEYSYDFESTWAGGVFTLGGQVDALRGLNRDDQTNLPRVTPSRESLNIVYKAERVRGELQVERSERQDRTAPFETATNAYTLVHLNAEIPFRLVGLDATALAQIKNIFDQEARNHVSVIKDVAPLPGRDFVLGLRAVF